jgi:hypothetical protein
MVRIVDGDYELPCGASLRVRAGVLEACFQGRPTPSRATVTREIVALIGNAVWLENWPEDHVLHHGVGWPGIIYTAIVLDVALRASAATDLATLCGVLSELERDEPGWSDVATELDQLPSFGGEAPVLPETMFTAWDQPGFPPRALSWDVDRVVVAGAPRGLLFCVPRHPKEVFGRVARASGVALIDDAEVFTRLASALRCADSYTLNDSLYVLDAHDASGAVIALSDAVGVAVRQRRPSPVQVVREVVAVAHTRWLARYLFGEPHMV